MCAASCVSIAHTRIYVIYVLNVISMFGYIQHWRVLVSCHLQRLVLDILCPREDVNQYLIQYLMDSK
jgi:hypothetical protein